MSAMKPSSATNHKTTRPSSSSSTFRAPQVTAKLSKFWPAVKCPPLSERNRASIAIPRRRPSPELICLDDTSANDSKLDATDPLPTTTTDCRDENISPPPVDEKNTSPPPMDEKNTSPPPPVGQATTISTSFGFFGPIVGVASESAADLFDTMGESSNEEGEGELCVALEESPCSSIAPSSDWNSEHLSASTPSVARPKTCISTQQFFDISHLDSPFVSLATRSKPTLPRLIDDSQLINKMFDDSSLSIDIPDDLPSTSTEVIDLDTPPTGRRKRRSQKEEEDCDDVVDGLRGQPGSSKQAEVLKFTPPKQKRSLLNESVLERMDLPPTQQRDTEINWRQKHVRAQMIGHESPLSKKYYDGLNLSPASRAARVQQVSRHRTVYEQLQKTPEHYWRNVMDCSSSPNNFGSPYEEAKRQIREGRKKMEEEKRAKASGIKKLKYPKDK